MQRCMIKTLHQLQTSIATLNLFKFISGGKEVATMEGQM